MPIYANTEAREFWKPGHARTLAATHFAHLKTNPDGTSDNEYRRKTCAQIVKDAAINGKAVSYQKFLQTLSGQNTRNIFAKLEARLLPDLITVLGVAASSRKPKPLALQ